MLSRVTFPDPITFRKYIAFSRIAFGGERDASSVGPPVVVWFWLEKTYSCCTSSLLQNSNIADLLNLHKNVSEWSSYVEPNGMHQNQLNIRALKTCWLFIHKERYFRYQCDSSRSYHSHDPCDPQGSLWFPRIPVIPMSVIPKDPC